MSTAPIRLVRARVSQPAIRTLLALLLALGMAATSTAAPALADAPSQLIGARLNVAIAFGSALTFRLDAPWTEPAPAGAEVRFGLPNGIVTNRAAADVQTQNGALRATYRWPLRGDLVPGAEIEYRFVVTEASGDLRRTAAARVIYMDPTLDWTRVREGLIEIWYYDGGADLAREARQAVRRALRLLEDDFGIVLTRPTRLVLYADVQRMQAALGGGTSPWVGGAAIADFNVTVLHAAAEPRYRRDIEAVIAHELTHIVIEHATDNPFGGLPAWLHEGLATTVESSIFERFPYADIMDAAVKSGEFVSLRGITGAFPASGRRAVQAYAQSNSLVAYVIGRWGHGGIAGLLQAYAGGVTDDEAVMAALGTTLDELEHDWLAAAGVSDPTFAGLTDRPDIPIGDDPARDSSGPGVPGNVDAAAGVIPVAVGAMAATLVIGAWIVSRRRRHGGDLYGP